MLGCCWLAWRRRAPAASTADGDGGEGDRLLTASGWASVALLVTLAWVLPWYVLWVLPLTSSDKDNMYHYRITSGETGSVVILSQLRLISSKRLQRLMFKLPKGQFAEIVSAVQRFFPCVS